MIIPIDVTKSDFDEQAFRNELTGCLYQPIAVHHGDLLLQIIPSQESLELSFPDEAPPFVAFVSTKPAKKKDATGLAIAINTNSRLMAKAIWQRTIDSINYEDEKDAKDTALMLGRDPNICMEQLAPRTIRAYQTYVESFIKAFPTEYCVSFADNEEDRVMLENKIKELCDHVHDDEDRRAKLRAFRQRQQELTPDKALEELNQALADAEIQLDSIALQKLGARKLIIDQNPDSAKYLTLQFAPTEPDKVKPPKTETDNNELPPESESIARTPDAHELYQLAESYHTDLEFCREQLHQVKTDLSRERTRADTFEQLLSERTQTEETAPFQTIPKNLVDLLDIIQASFPTRIVVHKDAYDSAESFIGNLDDEWSVLLACATTLWDIVFTDDDDSNRVSTRFQKTTGLELSLHETSGTMSNEKLRALRQHVYRKPSPLRPTSRDARTTYACMSGLTTRIGKSLSPTQARTSTPSERNVAPARRSKQSQPNKKGSTWINPDGAFSFCTGNASS